MSTFSRKIQEKRAMDRQMLAQSSERIYHSLQKRSAEGEKDSSGERAARELQSVCRFFGKPKPQFPKGMTDAETLMQFLMSETGIMRRKIVLKGKWWKDGALPLLCSDREGNAWALLPAADGGYLFLDNGKERRVTEKNAGLFLDVCYCFYQPFEQDTFGVRDFLLFLCKAFRASDVVWLLSVSLLAGLLGMIMPAINRFIFHSVVPSGTSKELFGIAVLIVGAVFMQAFCGLARTVWVMRIGNKMELLAQNAVWARVLSLPAGFFSNYSSGELAERVVSVDTICEILGGQLVPTLLSAVFSFVYLFQIRAISPALSGISFLIVLGVILVNAVTAVLKMREAAHNNRIKSRLSGMTFQFLEGIAKIKVAGAQARVFEKWAKTYSEQRLVPGTLLLCSDAFHKLITFGGTIVLYVAAYRAHMSASDYIGFQTAFGLFTAAVMNMLGISSQLAALKPAFEMLRPILEEMPENDGYRKQTASLSGEIELNQVRFRYREDMPYVLDGLELHIQPGEYLGIVGASGCGKSTLLRILLGFEKPQSGSVYYDMQDMNGLDLRSLRRRIGVVLQNGKLFSGDIYSNIVICAPWLSVEDAWRAAERSGLVEDIRNMPMGMFTMISEGGGGLSGGQQQRLLIARALAADPDIVMFDEATSALDNGTQKLVVQTLEEMQCTRLVIAHRLSTIKNCSRIIYLDQGRIAESGTYEELMKLGGKFAGMAERQLLS